MFKIKLLYPDAKAPTKAHADDSGWDLYAHSFKKVFVGPPPEMCLEPDPVSGLIPGMQSVPSVLTLNPMERVLIGCGFAGYVDIMDKFLTIDNIDFKIDLKLVPRSGNRLKEGLEVHFGTIDISYRGEFGVILTNLGNQAREIKLGDRVAQAVPMLVPLMPLVIVSDLDETVRGASGFGDSGKA